MKSISYALQGHFAQTTKTQSHFPLLVSISADYSFGFMHPGLTVNYMNYMWTKKTVDHHSLICLSYNPEIMDEWKQWIDIDIQIQRGPS